MIIRSEKKGNYTILPNEFLLDDTISDKSRGLLARLLSRPDNWNLNVNYLVKTGKTGHVAVRSAIKELEDAGYIQKEVSRHANGRIIGVEYIIRDSAGAANHPVEVNKMVEVQVKSAAPEIEAMEDHIEDSAVNATRMKETQNKETASIINTDIKQILKETTTTAHDPVVCGTSAPLSPSSFHGILNLVPEQHRSPMVVTFVNKAIVDYPENEVKEAVAYAAGNVRGGSMQFRAYLDKTLKNKWAEGYLDLMQAQGGCLNHHDPDRARRHAEGRAWLMGLDSDSLKILAQGDNIAAREELHRRESDMHMNTMVCKRQYARA